MYLKKDDKVIRRIRIVIDIVNTLLILVTLFLGVYAFLDVNNRVGMFPAIFVLGAIVNFISGTKHMISGKKALGLVSFVMFVILIIVSNAASVVIGGM